MELLGAESAMDGRVTGVKLNLGPQKAQMRRQTSQSRFGRLGLLVSQTGRELPDERVYIHHTCFRTEHQTTGSLYGGHRFIACVTSPERNPQNSSN